MRPPIQTPPPSLPNGPVDVAGPAGGVDNRREVARGWSALIAALCCLAIGFVAVCIWLVEALREVAR